MDSQILWYILCFINILGTYAFAYSYILHGRNKTLSKLSGLFIMALTLSLILLLNGFIFFLIFTVIEILIILPLLKKLAVRHEYLTNKRFTEYKFKNAFNKETEKDKRHKELVKMWTEAARKAKNKAPKRIL